MDTSIISSLGGGSGINVQQLVRDLAAASREPKVGRIAALAEQNQARISAVAQARSDLDGLANSLSEIVTDGTLRSAPTVSNTAILEAASSPGTSASAFTASVEVLELARAQSASSAVVASRSAAVGQGVLDISVGTSSFAVTIDATNDSLDGLATAINAAGSGVRASVVGDGGGFRLVLKGETGAAKAFTVALGAGADPALAAFTTGSGLTVAQTARDASVRVDGVNFTRDRNDISDLLSGITLNLKKASVGEIVTIGATRPVAAIRQALSDFVSVFNQIRASVANAVQLSGAGSDMRQLASQLQGVAGATLTSHASINRLSDVGVSTTRDGTLLLDNAKLEAALLRDPEAVEALFNPVRSTTRTEVTDPGLGGFFDALRDRAVGTDGAIDRATKSLEARRKQLEQSLARVEEREAAYAARLERQYARLDIQVGALRATQAYLEQQIKIWNGSNE
jgi:flagellar hook-associated protein 2